MNFDVYFYIFYILHTVDPDPGSDLHLILRSFLPDKSTQTQVNHSFVESKFLQSLYQRLPHLSDVTTPVIERAHDVISCSLDAMWLVPEASDVMRIRV